MVFTFSVVVDVTGVAVFAFLVVVDVTTAITASEPVACWMHCDVIWRVNLIVSRPWQMRLEAQDVRHVPVIITDQQTAAQ